MHSASYLCGFQNILGGLGCKEGNTANVFLIPEGLHPHPLPHPPASPTASVVLAGWHCLPEPASLVRAHCDFSNEESLDQSSFAFALVYVHENAVRQHFPCSREGRMERRTAPWRKTFRICMYQK